MPGLVTTIRELAGASRCGRSTKATIFLGPTTGIKPGQRKGRKKFSAETATLALLFRRMQQIGKTNAGLSAIRKMGWYKGEQENSIRVEITFVPNDEEKTAVAFYRNIGKLARLLAGDLAQRSITVEYSSPAARRGEEACKRVRRYKRDRAQEQES